MKSAKVRGGHGVGQLGGKKAGFSGSWALLLRKHCRQRLARPCFLQQEHGANVQVGRGREEVLNTNIMHLWETRIL